MEGQDRDWICGVGVLAYLDWMGGWNRSDLHWVRNDVGRICSAGEEWTWTRLLCSGELDWIELG